MIVENIFLYICEPWVLYLNCATSSVGLGHQYDTNLHHICFKIIYNNRYYSLLCFIFFFQVLTPCSSSLCPSFASISLLIFLSPPKMFLNIFFIPMLPIILLWFYLILMSQMWMLSTLSSLALSNLYFYFPLAILALISSSSCPFFLSTSKYTNSSILSNPYFSTSMNYLKFFLTFLSVPSSNHLLLLLHVLSCFFSGFITIIFSSFLDLGINVKWPASAMIWCSLLRIVSSFYFLLSALP